MNKLHFYKLKFRFSLALFKLKAVKVKLLKIIGALFQVKNNLSKIVLLVVLMPNRRHLVKLSSILFHSFLFLLFNKNYVNLSEL